LAGIRRGTSSRSDAGRERAAAAPPPARRAGRLARIGWAALAMLLRLCAGVTLTLSGWFAALARAADRRAFPPRDNDQA